eukprot:TRINITY_DN14553_c0_g1_i1.p1 TRINITY_DN14553_c0_g1~~TRINITY_DN14553_c0_g1_i1.p1  ORF type:complete len:193 (-),score=-6.56 TRINITY_DN14553_c0_g1_i1:32-610(-)
MQYNSYQIFLVLCQNFFNTFADEAIFDQIINNCVTKQFWKKVSDSYFHYEQIRHFFQCECLVRMLYIFSGRKFANNICDGTQCYHAQKYIQQKQFRIFQNNMFFFHKIILLISLVQIFEPNNLKNFRQFFSLIIALSQKFDLKQQVLIQIKYLFQFCIFQMFNLGFQSLLQVTMYLFYFMFKKSGAKKCAPL